MYKYCKGSWPLSASGRFVVDREVLGACGIGLQHVLVGIEVVVGDRKHWSRDGAARAAAPKQIASFIANLE